MCVCWCVTTHRCELQEAVIVQGHFEGWLPGSGGKPDNMDGYPSLLAGSRWGAKYRWSEVLSVKRSLDVNAGSSTNSHSSWEPVQCPSQGLFVTSPHWVSLSLYGQHPLKKPQGPSLAPTTTLTLLPHSLTSFEPQENSCWVLIFFRTCLSSLFSFLSPQPFSSPVPL